MGAGRWVLVLADAAGVADSATVWLDGGGLPSHLQFGEGEEAVTYRLSGWRFPRARGAKGFTLTAPPGFETIDVP